MCSVRIKILWILSGLLLLTANTSGQVTSSWIKNMFSHPAKHAGLPELDDSYGVVFKDLNEDGQPDLYITRFRNLNRFFVNRGGEFIDLTIASGLGGNLFPHRKYNLELGASAVHVTGLSYPEIMIVGWQTTALYQKSYGTMYRFLPLPESEKIDGNGVAWADFDGNGYLDAFISDEHHHNHLYLNMGFGSFVKADSAWGLVNDEITQSGAVCDLNEDGRPDLYVCNWKAPDRFYMNREGRRFIPVDLSIFHTRESVNSNHANFVDLDNDGDLDLIVADRSGFSRIYRNVSHILGEKKTIAFEPFPGYPFYSNPAYSATVADFNNDGFLDIYWAGIGQNALMLGDSAFVFHTVYVDKFTESNAYSTGVAVADYDLDGDVDLFISNKDTTATLYTNPLQNSHYIRVRLAGKPVNRDAIGSRVYLFLSGAGKPILKGMRWVGCANGYLSESENVNHFGVPHEGNYRIKVIFPSGRIKTVENVSQGETITVYEEGPWVMRLNYWRHRVISGVHSSLFFPVFLMVLGIILLIFIYFYPLQRRYENSPKELVWVITLVFGALLIPSFLLNNGGPLLMVRIQFTAVLIVLGAATIRSELVHRSRIEHTKKRDDLLRFSSAAIQIHENRKLLEQFVNVLHKTLGPVSVALYNGSTPHNLLYIQGEPKRFPENVEEVISVMPDEAQFVRRYKSGVLPGFNAPVLVIQLHQKILYGIIIVLFEDSASTVPQEVEDMVKLIINQINTALENNTYIEKQKEMGRQIAEQDVKQKYIHELESRNKQLMELTENLKNTRMQLIQSEKLAGLGQLVAGIAHELNNPISFIYANSLEMNQYLQIISEMIENIDELSREMPDEKESIASGIRGKLQQLEIDLREIIGDNLEGSRRVKDIVQNLRDFARTDSGEKTRVDINAGIKSTLRLLKKKIEPGISVVTNLGESCFVNGHAGQLNQVFMNIMVNALQAMDKNGELHIRTCKEGTKIKIEIADTGHGIPKEILRHIFDPFYTTRPIGEGTGLGLSVSHTIIQNHGGKIDVKSDPSTGTLFIIVLPAADNQERIPVNE